MSETFGLPTLGYPTRYEAAAALREQGMDVNEIAERIGTSRRAVYQLLDYARNGSKNRTGRKIFVSGSTFEALADPAKERGVKPADLARRILAIVAKEGLADAILDDRSPA